MTIALIGCGVAGSAIAERLVKRGKEKNIKLVDSDANKLNRILSNLQNINDKINYSSIQLNATETTNIEKSLEGVELVINAASPICNIPIMKTCLKTGTNYIDLASDPFEYPDIKGTSFDDQLKLHDRFVNKNLLALTNAGFSPGFTDILCKHVININSLDSVKYIKIYFGEKIESEKLVVSWSPYILLLETISPPTVYNKKEIVTVDSEKNLKNIDFSEPIGKIKLSVFSGHPELRTIPNYIDIPIDYIEVGGGYLLNDMDLNDVIVAALRKRVENSTFFKGDVFEILSNSFEKPDNFVENFKRGIIKNEHVSCLFEIKGERRGEILKYHATIEHNLRDIIKTFSSGSVASFMVSFVPAIIAEKILFKEIKDKGVIAPAALSNSGDIINDCKKMGLNIKESIKWY